MENSEMVEAARAYFGEQLDGMFDVNDVGGLVKIEFAAQFAAAQIAPYKTALADLVDRIDDPYPCRACNGSGAQQNDPWQGDTPDCPKCKGLGIDVRQAITAAKAVLTNGGQDADK